eukprot:gene9770-biopygen8618
MRRGDARWSKAQADDAGCKFDAIAPTLSNTSKPP